MISLEIPNLMLVIEKLTAFEATLKVTLASAGVASGDLVIKTAQSKMDFKHPTGQFENSLQTRQLDPYTEEIYSELPYGNRLEWGFMGADSLGRHYDEQGMHFMMFTIEDPNLTGQVAMKYLNAFSLTWNTIVSLAGAGASE